MVCSMFKEFLEGSTIHGLVHISTAKSRRARFSWTAIVVACFAIAVYMITSSYKEWQDSPVSTTIKDVNFTAEDREDLLDISKEVFIEIPNTKHAKDMIELISVENMMSIANGQASMPKVDKGGMVVLESWEPQGTF